MSVSHSVECGTIVADFLYEEAWNKGDESDKFSWVGRVGSPTVIEAGVNGFSLVSPHNFQTKGGSE